MNDIYIINLISLIMNLKNSITSMTHGCLNHRKRSFKSISSSSIYNNICLILLTNWIIRCTSLNVVNSHIILTRDDTGGKFLLTEQDGAQEGGNLVIANDGHQHSGSGGGQNRNFVMQDADNRDGDVVMDGKNLVIPGEDGHIVLADSRNDNNHGHNIHHYQQGHKFSNFCPYWFPFWGSRLSFMPHHK